MTTRRRIVLAIAAVLLLGLTALGLAARAFLSGDGIKRAIEVQAGAALGRPVAIGSAVPRFYPRVGL